MDLSIVIVTHDSTATIEGCLRAVQRATPAPVLVVDNASADGTPDTVRARGVRVLAMAENIGFGAAANAGARAAKTDAVCLLNPDCEPEADLFQEGIRVLAAHAGDCVVPLLVNEQGAIMEGRQPGYTRWKLLADILETNGRSARAGTWVRRAVRVHDTRWHWPLGTCILIARERFLELGGFDPTYFMYMEDVDLGFRLHRAGGAVHLLPIRLLHRAQQGSGISRTRRLTLLNKGRLTYAGRRYGRCFRGLLQLLVRCGGREGL